MISSRKAGVLVLALGFLLVAPLTFMPENLALQISKENVREDNFPWNTWYNEVQSSAGCTTGYGSLTIFLINAELGYSAINDSLNELTFANQPSGSPNATVKGSSSSDVYASPCMVVGSYTIVSTLYTILENVLYLHYQVVSRVAVPISSGENVSAQLAVVALHSVARMDSHVGSSGPLSTGGTTVLTGNFSNAGLVPIRVSDLEFTFDFGTFRLSNESFPYTLSEGAKISLRVPIRSPVGVPAGNHSFISTTHWGYWNPNLSEWVSHESSQTNGSLLIQMPQGVSSIFPWGLERLVLDNLLIILSSSGLVLIAAMTLIVRVRRVRSRNVAS